ncbi:MAG TPA: hypothetical protein VKY19_09735 [Ktedonosporobacter sp.]|jgi:hypothetical protein|nr:hypothetical protein [Ktedonosporobacter sp.]
MMFEIRPKTILTLMLLTLALTMSFLFVATPRASASTVPVKSVLAGTPNFTVTVDPLSQTRKRGTGAPYFVTINPVNGFNGSVKLSLTGNIPPNGVVSISQPGLGPLNDGEVDIQILKHTFVTGTFAMTIHAVSGSLEHDVNISLTIV